MEVIYIYDLESIEVLSLKTKILNFSVLIYYLVQVLNV